MEYSYVDGLRRSPEPGLRGLCDLCGGETVSRCGEVRIHHWAHLRIQNCDPWWENETDWHRNSKQDFPEHCREVVVISEDGKKHRADVKTDIGRVVEFQRSSIKPTERRAREEFYGDMIWVIYGLRSDHDFAKFDKLLNDAAILQNTPIKIKIEKGSCSLLRTWAHSSVGVYLDFCDRLFSDPRFEFSRPTLWRLFPNSSERYITVAPVWRQEFINAALHGVSISGISDVDLEIAPDPEEPVLPRSTRPARVEGPSIEQQRPDESDIDYAIRAWDIEELLKN